MEFLGRLEQLLQRTLENRWTIIKSMNDECFQQVNDNWWMAIRQNVDNFQDFKLHFKNKY